MTLPSSPDIIDPAILRPGRLDKTLFVGLPPPADRLAILKTITKVSKGNDVFLCIFSHFRYKYLYLLNICFMSTREKVNDFDN